LRAPVAAATTAALLAALIALRVPLCPVAALFGMPCPGCGLGRATLALAHGDVRGALAFHPLVLVVLPTLALGTVRVLRSPQVRRPARARSATLFAIAAAALLAALIGVWISRFFGAFGGPVAVAGPVWSRFTH
jgi:hypothetical protein